MRRLAITLLLLTSVALAEKPAQPTHFHLVQIGVQEKTGTPIMGCATGQTLMRLEKDYGHVYGKPDAQGTIPITVVRIETWRISEDQTLLGDLHKRKHHECWLNGTTQGAK